MRVKRGYTLRRRHKRLLNQAEGFRGRRKNCYKIAKRSVQRSMLNAYESRRLKKRDFRALWIVRINAAVRPLGLSYSRLIAGLQKANIALDRKILAELAMNDIAAFNAVAERAKQALA